ncbi:MAG: lytic transglycosylase domain-containing protein [Terriglobales bacterium]
MRKYLRAWPAVALTMMLGCVPAMGGDIAPVQEDGRMIYRNDLPDRKPAARPSTPSAGSRYYYWSVVEKRWKRVPKPTQRAVAAARSAAAEVSEYVAAQPVAEGTPDAGVNPNYGALVRGRAVSSSEVEAVIEAAAARHNVDANLVRALIKVESNFNPRALSRKGAMGLMQLMPATARSLRVANPFDPEQNVDAGVRHLKGLLENYNGDVALSLAAYNAGAGAVARSGGVPPYRETRNYVRQITQIYGGGDTVVTGPSYAPIRASRQQNGVLRFSNTD